MVMLPLLVIIKMNNPRAIQLELFLPAQKLYSQTKGGLGCLRIGRVLPSFLGELPNWSANQPASFPR